VEQTEEVDSMSKEFREYIRFVLKVNLRYYPRLLAAPLIGAVRQVWETVDRMDAEIDAFVAEQNERVERAQPLHQAR
jgi:hypothetical protein